MSGETMAGGNSAAGEPAKGAGEPAKATGSAGSGSTGPESKGPESRGRRANGANGRPIPRADPSGAAGIGTGGGSDNPSAQPQADTAAGAAAATPERSGPKLNPRTVLLGEAVALLLQSPVHRLLFLQDLEWQLLPPLSLGQFRIWRREAVPVVYASWAFVSPEVDARLGKSLVRLAPSEWKSGDILWLMDIIAPFGGMEPAIKELRESVFKGRSVKSLQPAPGGGMGVVTW